MTDTQTVKQYIYFSESYSYLYLYALIYNILRGKGCLTIEQFEQHFDLNISLNHSPIELFCVSSNDMFQFYINKYDGDTTFVKHISRISFNNDYSLNSLSLPPDHIRPSYYIRDSVYEKSFVDKIYISNITTTLHKEFLSDYPQPLDSETLLHRISTSYNLSLVKYSL